jgi:hypothetical protein
MLKSDDKAGRKQFFFEKKNQKTFVPMAYTFLHRVPRLAKVFWFFFSKKNSFFPVHS